MMGGAYRQGEERQEERPSHPVPPARQRGPGVVGRGSRARPPDLARPGPDMRRRGHERVAIPSIAAALPSESAIYRRTSEENNPRLSTPSASVSAHGRVTMSVAAMATVNIPDGGEFSLTHPPPASGGPLCGTSSPISPTSRPPAERGFRSSEAGLSHDLGASTSAQPPLLAPRSKLRIFLSFPPRSLFSAARPRTDPPALFRCKFATSHVSLPFQPIKVLLIPITRSGTRSRLQDHLTPSSPPLPLRLQPRRAARTLIRRLLSSVPSPRPSASTCGCGRWVNPLRAPK